MAGVKGAASSEIADGVAGWEAGGGAEGAGVGAAGLAGADFFEVKRSKNPIPQRKGANPVEAIRKTF